MKTQIDIELKNELDKLIEATDDQKIKSDRQLLREYFFNPKFRKAFENEIYRLNTQPQ